MFFRLYVCFLQIDGGMIFPVLFRLLNIIPQKRSTLPQSLFQMLMCLMASKRHAVIPHSQLLDDEAAFSFSLHPLGEILLCLLSDPL